MTYHIMRRHIVKCLIIILAVHLSLQRDLRLYLLLILILVPSISTLTFPLMRNFTRIYYKHQFRKRRIVDERNDIIIRSYKQTKDNHNDLSHRYIFSS